jgi:hypothetical protein
MTMLLGSGWWRRVAVALVTLLVVVGLAGTSRFAAQAFDLCGVSDPVLEGAPGDIHSGSVAGIVPPLRRDIDGQETMTGAVEEPFDGTYDDIGIGFGVGVYWHVWPTARRMISYGVYHEVAFSVVRTPLFVVENPPSDDPNPIAQALAEWMRDGQPPADNTTVFAANTLAPTATGFAMLFAAAASAPYVHAVFDEFHLERPQVYDLVRDWFNPSSYPADSAGQNHRPVFVWTIYRTAPGLQAWAGIAIMHGGARLSATGIGSGGGSYSSTEACDRVRIGAVTRTNDGTVYHGGVFVDDRTTGEHNALWPGPQRSTARQTITAGLTIGGASWTDVPLVSVRQREDQDGTTVSGPYREHQQDTITMGVEGPNGFVPLLGTQSSSSHAVPPQAERHTVSLGVFDPTGVYHPVVGTQTQSSAMPMDAWIGSAGAGALTINDRAGDPAVGSWQANIGTYVTATGEYQPVFGAGYQPDFAGARDRYRAMLTAGPYTRSRYRPLVASTYDGTRPAGAGLLFDRAGNGLDVRGLDGRWLVSAGTFMPDGKYLPLTGASFERRDRASVDEEYRVGTFTGTYHRWKPLVGASYRSDRPSAQWAWQYYTSGERVPADAAVDAGPVLPGVGYKPIVGVRATKGSPDRYGVGAWIAGGFLPLLEVCHGRTSYGIAARGGSSRVPIVWVDPGGFPTFVGDCPP